MYSIEIQNLKLAFNAQVLFEQFNFTLPQGKWTSLLGASGIGKSTLLRVIAGLEKESILQGKINFAPNTKLAWLAQHESLFPWLSIVDNVRLHAHLTGQKNAENLDKALHLLELVKMTPHLNKPCYQLSGGQKQRVALARTLMQDANLILMDEPFSALDAVTRYQLQDLAYQLLVNKTVLLITHDPQEAIRLSHHIAILAKQPACLTEITQIQGVPPRALTETEFSQLQQQLLEVLSEGGLR
ncbi:ABC transporter ATP-binding protein [Haemophilus haemoglobinophilus]|nr:ABC transporter ATP-binding protein [Canicola haemoglobinophilus]MBN6712144.1 ABC transporter ATP-binding protein [Canicola haemoglobinophilus]